MPPDLALVIFLTLLCIPFVLIPPLNEISPIRIILGPGGMAEEYPTNLTVGEEGEVFIGVVNHEYAAVTYQLELKLNGGVIDQKSIVLTHNETWEGPFTFKPKKAGEDQKLEFLWLFGNLR